MLGRNAYGHTVETDAKSDNEKFAYGYAKTQGYINYRGKGWSVIIKQGFDLEDDNDPMDNSSEH
jgi:hypothetical protein